MTMQSWRPRLLRTWRPIEDMGRFLEDPFFEDWPFFRVMWRIAPGDGMTWAPAIEVYEKDNGFVVRAELPGVKKDDVDISITGDALTIKGERKEQAEVSDQDYYR